jgi:hypothetical protein
VPAVDAFLDHTTLVAFAKPRLANRTMPGPDSAFATRWPERPAMVAHPDQGLRYRLRERLLRRRGGGLAGVFRAK